MTTPEGKIKKKIDAMLKSKSNLWYFKPQAGQYGRSGVSDYIICSYGQLVGVEAKADKTKKPTALQAQCMEKIEAAGGKAYVVYDQATLDHVESVLDMHEKLYASA